MTNLEYYLHDEADALRIEIVRNLSGAGVDSIEQAWRTPNSVLAGRYIVDGLMDRAMGFVRRSDVILVRGGVRLHLPRIPAR